MRHNLSNYNVKNESMNAGASALRTPNVSDCIGLTSVRGVVCVL